MKSNDAPEKIYIIPRQGGDYSPYWKNDSQDEFGIEYTRTDAFIEKADKWFKEHKDAIAVMGFIPDYYIEDFKNYMKGE